jgi:hypothetical protein
LTEWETDITVGEVKASRFMKASVKDVLSSDWLEKEPLLLKAMEDSKNNFTAADSRNRLLALLLYEKHLCRDSFWWPYFRTLPRRADLELVLLNWSPEEVEQELRGTTAVWEYDQGRNFVDSVHLYTSSLRRLEPDVIPPIFNDKEQVRWAVSILTSRSFHYPYAGEHTFSSIVPVADMVNHADDARGTWVEKDGIVYFLASLDERGEQAFISYGQVHTAAAFLSAFGFIPAVQKPELLKLRLNPKKPKPLRPTVGSLPMLSGKKEYLITSCQFPKELLHSLRASFLTPAEVVQNTRKLTQGELLSPTIERAVISHLLLELEDKIQTFPSTEEEDEAIVEGKKTALSEKKRLAAFVRAEERRGIRAMMVGLRREWLVSFLDEGYPNLGTNKSFCHQ